MPDFSVNDKRSSAGDGDGPSRSSIAAANLRARGFALPSSPVMARKAVRDVEASVENRELVKTMRRTGSATHSRTAANTQMALPKVREPMSSLKDKNIPFDTTNAKELIEIRRWARLFYSTHDLIPLLIDIYSKFPLVGLEFKSKDPQIKDFYESMFMDGLDYDTFLQDLGREYFISGEVNSLAHFDETLGVWSAEEILNPDAIGVSKSMFQDKERVQLLVKDLVETLRASSSTSTDDETTRSEKLEKNWEYQQILENYPEIVEAANNDDGLDISDALISRIVNKVQPWDLRGTPHLLRSFRTLLMEESLNAAQDAVADRLYSPFILATLGIANLGDNQPWIPDQADLDEARDTMQDALAADFRLMVHNFGFDIKSVFGRESVPRFDTDYNRIDKKLMQAWGIGEALISGSSSSTYAGSALNREFVTQMMGTFQKAVKKHMRKRAMVIAEAQEHFDYELKGGSRKPIFREIVEFDEATGEEYTRRVPKLLIPEIEFSTLNLRDEAQERSFLQQLKNNGVPISDKSLAVNIPIEFTEELEAVSEEKVQKLVAEAQTMKKAYDLIKAQGLPMPPELAKYEAAQVQLQKIKDEAEGGGESAGAGIPGAVPPPIPPGGEPAAPFGADEGTETEPAEGAASAEDPFGVDLDNSLDADALDNSDADLPDEPGPFMDYIDENESSEGGGESGSSNVIPFKQKTPPPRNRSRPEESDEMRKTMPKKSSFGQPPSSYGTAKTANEQRISSALKRLSNPNPVVRDLVDNDQFFESLNQQSYVDQVRNDIDSLYLAVEVDRDGQPRLASKDETLTESFSVLSEMLGQYEEIYGFRPEW